MCADTDAEGGNAAVGGGFEESVLGDRCGGDDEDCEIGVEGADVDEIRYGGGFVTANTDGSVGGATDGDAIGSATTFDEEVSFGDRHVGFICDALAGEVLTFGDVGENNETRSLREESGDGREFQEKFFHW